MEEYRCAKAERIHSIHHATMTFDHHQNLYATVSLIADIHKPAKPANVMIKSKNAAHHENGVAYHKHHANKAGGDNSTKKNLPLFYLDLI